MSLNIQLSTFYVELDCLLDTRLSLISEYGEKAVETALEKGYLTRLTDDFEGIDSEEFKKAYDNRDNRILKNAVMTPIVKMLKDFAVETVRTSINSPFKLQPNIVVNAYPYKFTKEEETLLLSTIAYAINDICDVSLIYEPMENIMPDYVKKTYSIMAMYRYDLWGEYHADKKHFEKVICPEVTLIGPRLYFNGIPKKEDLDNLPNENKDPFTCLEECFKPVINLNTYPVSFFSININNGSTEGFSFGTS